AVAKPQKRGPAVAGAAATPAPPAPAPAVETQGPQTAAGSPIETEVQPEPPPPPAPPDAAVAPPPVAAPAIAVVKPTVKAPPAPGSLDATPSVASLEVKGSLSPSIVRRSVERTLASMRACYRTAARATKSTPAIELKLTFEIDENNLATQVATSGSSAFGSLATCAASVAGQIRTQ